MGEHPLAFIDSLTQERRTSTKRIPIEFGQLTSACRFELRQLLLDSRLPLGVFSSALSPMAMGMLIDMGYGMGVLMGLNIALALLAQAGGAMMLGRPPRLATT